jgi:hypothetical protein
VMVRGSTVCSCANALRKNRFTALEAVCASSLFSVGSHDRPLAGEPERPTS